MTGIVAITAQNGWSMVFVGAFIVISGMSLLALIIAQLHKIITFWNRRFGED